MASVCSAVKGSPCARTRSAARRRTGGWPTERWRSEAPVVAGGHEQGVELRLARARLRGEGGLLERVLVGERRLAARRHLAGDLEGPRADGAGGVLLRHVAHEVEHLRVLEVAEGLDDLDPHLGGGVLEQLREAGHRPQVADPAERLDRAPARLGVGERLDEGRDPARVLQAAQGLGGGDADPPVRVLQQADRGGHDARVLEGLGHQHGRGAHLLVRVGEQLDRRLEEVVAEGAHRLERAVAGPAGERLREDDVAPDHLAAVRHPEQDLEDDRARAGLARGHEGQDAVGEGRPLPRRGAGERLDQDLLGRVVDEGELLDEEVDRALPRRAGRARPAPSRGPPSRGRGRGAASGAAPSRRSATEARRVRKASAVLDAAGGGQVPEHRLERAARPGRRGGAAARSPAPRPCRAPRARRGAARCRGCRARRGSPAADADRRLRLALALGDDGVGRLGVGEALQQRRRPRRGRRGRGGTASRRRPSPAGPPPPRAGRGAGRAPGSSGRPCRRAASGRPGRPTGRSPCCAGV